MSFGAAFRTGLSHAFGNTMSSLANFGNTAKQGLSSAVGLASDGAKIAGDVGSAVAPIVSQFNPQAGNMVSGVSAGLKAAGPLGHDISSRINDLPVSSLLKR